MIIPVHIFYTWRSLSIFWVCWKLPKEYFCYWHCPEFFQIFIWRHDNSNRPINLLPILIPLSHCSFYPFSNSKLIVQPTSKIVHLFIWFAMVSSQSTWRTHKHLSFKSYSCTWSKFSVWWWTSSKDISQLISWSIIWSSFRKRKKFFTIFPTNEEIIINFFWLWPISPEIIILTQNNSSFCKSIICQSIIIIFYGVVNVNSVQHKSIS